MSSDQRLALEKIKKDIQDAHELFSHANDAQHAYLDIAELAIDKVLEDPYYGCILRD
jgi:hypothetical protein